MKHLPAILALLLLPLAAALPAAAQPDDPAPDRRVQVRFEQADIRRVTQLVGQLTGETFLLPDAVTGQVSILTQGPVAVSDVLPLYLDMLEASGYTAVRRDGAWQVLPLPPGGGLPPSDADIGLVSRIVPLEHVPAADVKKALEPLVRGGAAGSLEAFSAGNRLVVTDTASAVARVEALAKELDIPGAGNTVELVALAHASPEDVARQLREVYGAAETAADRVNRHMAQVTAGLASAPPEFAVIPVPQAGSVALVGRPLQIADAKRLIARIDVESPYGFGRLHVIFLKYLSADEAAKSLNALFAKAATDAGAAADARRHIAIEPSIANNALLVDAAPQDFAYVSSVVAQLDVVPQQVLVEVLIAEMNLEKTHELGLEWFGVDAPEGSGSGGLARTMYGTADGMKSLLTEGSFSSGLSLAFMSGRFTAPDGTTYPQIPLYLRALAGDNDLKILSNIPLWAQNNREASVSVVENIPILKSSVEGSGSDRDYIQNIERQDVGIKLVLTPHVNPDNEIQLDLNPSIEAVASYGSGDAAQYTPTISKREVKTTVTVPDRATVVLSGLIREDETEIVSKVPLLGDIPLLGWLFRHTATAKKRTNLLIFVTPRIVTDPAMADAERARLERATSLSDASSVLSSPSPAAEKKRPKAPPSSSSFDAPVSWSK
ncbi:MAG: type II secretion system secretin GspD [Kiritimatiellae bacterium]|nr:type II secretion system secretin GspD [Kiritimatiellia bacterium]